MFNKSILLLLLFSVPFFASSENLSANKQPPSSELVSHVGLLNELSPRRQVNTFTPNQSSVITNGLQKHFVNVGSGQLSFLRRDLVTVGRRPLVMARIYDSSLVNSNDFGVGWQLSLAQTIDVLDDGTLLYRDDTASLYKFIPTTVGFKIHPAQNSDIKSVMYDAEGLLQITYLTGWVKRFVKLGNKHRLASITDNNKNRLTLIYNENKLSKVIGANGRSVYIARNEQGRITSITDNNGRVVSYFYNQKGLLKAVDDLGGNQWQYQYHGNGLLHKVTDPKGQLAGQFSFGKDKKATSVKIRARKYRYKYQANKTLVTDENGDSTAFTQNAQGVTTSVTNAEGFTSRIVLNVRNQISALWHNDELQASIVYDENGRPARYDINGKPTQMERELLQHNYQYDDAGRLLSVGDSSFTYDDRGNLTQHQTDKFVRTYQYADSGDVLSESTSVLGLAATTTHYEYNIDGQLTRIKLASQITNFAYNEIGKLSEVTFPDGANHSYVYDKLGFRKHTKRSDSSAVVYRYDKVGNLTQTTRYEPGTAVGKNNILTLNASNQVTTITSEDQTPITIEYTTIGSPKSITQGENTTEYQYDNLGRLRSAQTQIPAQNDQYIYQKGEDDIRLQLDDRTKGAKSHLTKITAHNQTQAQLQFARMTGSPWQSVIWNEALNKLLVPLPNEVSAPDVGYQSTKQRRRLRDAKSTIKQQQLDHDKPSNSQFIPVEYNLVNCDIVGDDGETGGTAQDCYLHGVILDDASTITAGVPYTFSAFAVADSKCDPRYTFAVDGAVVGLSDSGNFTYTFAQSGSHTVQTNAQCTRCLGYVKWDAMEVNVTPSDACATSLDGSVAGGCCGPDEPASTFDPAKADIEIQSAFSQTLPACFRGLSWEEAVDIDIGVRCHNGEYRAELTGLLGKYSKQVRLLPGPPQEQEVTGIGGNTTEANYCAQIIDLKANGDNCPSYWYIKEATDKHEDVHIAHFKPGLQSVAADIEVDIEALSVSAKGKTKAQAIAQIIALSSFKDAKVTARDKWFDANGPLLAPDHNGPTQAVEGLIVNPMRMAICKHAKDKNWKACSACDEVMITISDN